MRRGEVLALLGPNGAGKSTTAGMLTTTVRPTSGRAWVAGVDVAASPARVHRHIGVVPQRNTLDRRLNVRDNLIFHGRYFGMRPAAARGPGRVRRTARPRSDRAAQAAADFVIRTVVQPVLFLFGLGYVSPRIGQPAAGSATQTATTLLAGMLAIAILFQGLFAVALPLVQALGYTREIDDRLLAPLPAWAVALEKITLGTIQGLLAAVVIFPLAMVIPAAHPALHIHWAALLTLAPLAALMCASLGLFLRAAVTSQPH